MILAPDCTPGDVLTGTLENEPMLFLCFGRARGINSMNGKDFKGKTRVWTLQEARLSLNVIVKIRDGCVNLWTLENITEVMDTGP